MRLQILIAMAFFAGFLLSMPANGQVVRAVCPDGYVHQGEYCVGQGFRLPFVDFMRGGRWYGQHHFNHGRPVHRPPVHRPPGRPGHHGRH